MHPAWGNPLAIPGATGRGNPPTESGPHCELSRDMRGQAEGLTMKNRCLKTRVEQARIICVPEYLLRRDCRATRWQVQVRCSQVTDTGKPDASAPGSRPPPRLSAPLSLPSSAPSLTFRDQPGLREQELQLLREEGDRVNPKTLSMQNDCSWKL